MERKMADGPPVNVVTDAIPISRLVDGTLFMVSSKDTNKYETKNTLTLLQRKGVTVIGCVLTKVEESRNS